ncbi:MAG: glycosyltransferase family 2 protein [Verrucomicrobiales bacterium]
MMTPSRTHLVIIPSYNTGKRVLETLQAARQVWNPVWVVVDGSTDGTADLLEAKAGDDPGLEVLRLARNSGKGAAVLLGLREAHRRGFSHALTMDADGQHPPHRIPEFMRVSHANPDAIVLGVPVFDASVPSERLHGRKISNFLANLETFWLGIVDSLFGFRLYPIKTLLSIMRINPFMRHFDFDPEAAVRMVWRGCRPINIEAECRYFGSHEGGISHFHYVRTNVVLTWMHLRLLLGLLWRWPWLLWLRSSRR